MTGRILTCSSSEYYSDPCERPSLSASIAKIILDRSPAHAWLEHPRLGNQRKLPTKDMDQGQLIHTILLGEGVDVEVVEADDFRTKAAQQARDAARAAGKLPVIAAKYREAQKGVQTIRKNMAAFGIVLEGASEVPIAWEEEGRDGPVLCRAKLDHVFRDRRLIIDVKKAENAHPTAATKAVINYKYALQQVAYQRALSAVDGGPVEFLFVFCECEPPYAVLPARLDGAFRQIGEAQWQAAVHLWERCLNANEWPGYTNETMILQPPEWLAARELTDLEEGDNG